MRRWHWISWKTREKKSEFVYDIKGGGNYVEAAFSPFGITDEQLILISKGLLQKVKYLWSQNNLAKVVHDKLIVYEKVTGNDVSEAQDDP